MENFIKIGAEKIAESVIVENIVSYSKEFAQFCENNPFFIPYLLTTKIIWALLIDSKSEIKKLNKRIELKRLRVNSLKAKVSSYKRNFYEHDLAKHMFFWNSAPLKCFNETLSRTRKLTMKELAKHFENERKAKK